jgi:hypothetical protein
MRESWALEHWDCGLVSQLMHECLSESFCVVLLEALRRPTLFPRSPTKMSKKWFENLDEKIGSEWAIMPTQTHKVSWPPPIPPTDTIAAIDCALLRMIWVKLTSDVIWRFKGGTRRAKSATKPHSMHSPTQFTSLKRIYFSKIHFKITRYPLLISPK